MAACVGGQAVQIVRMMERERERERERARRELAERGERSFPRTGARIFDTFRLNTGYSILITVDGSIDHPSAQ
jgi:hypothetical protein